MRRTTHSRTFDIGAGRCRPPCQNDMDCAFNSTSNPHGGTKLKCAGEQLAGGGLSEKRCRSNSNCMDNLECPVQPDTSIYFGYCDRGQYDGGDACKLDCRTGNDPVTQKPYKDCREPYGCKLENGINKCILKTCVEQGGASIACNRGEYCCGEDKNLTDAGDPCPPASQRGPPGEVESAQHGSLLEANLLGREGAFEHGRDGTRITVGRRRTRQDEHERRARTRDGRDVEVAVHRPRELSRDRQPEARTVDPFVGRHPEEALEDSSPVVGGDPGRQHLQSHPARSPIFDHGLVHHAHAACSEQPPDAVAACQQLAPRKLAFPLVAQWVASVLTRAHLFQRSLGFGPTAPQLDGP